MFKQIILFVTAFFIILGTLVFAQTTQLLKTLSEKNKSSGDITFGSETQINSGGKVYFPSMDALSSSTFIVAYKDYTGITGKGVALIGTISGSGSASSISYSDKFTFEASDVSAVSVSALDNSTFVIAYRANDGTGEAIIGNVSGGSISFASSSEFCSNIYYSMYSHLISVTSLDASHFIIAYQNHDNSDYGEAIIGTVGSGNSITFNTTSVFNSSSTDYIGCNSFNSNSFVIAYKDKGNSNYGTAISGKVTYNESNPENTTLAFGPENVFESSSTYYCSIASLNSTSFVLAYGANHNGKALVGNVSYDSNPNGILTFGTSNAFNNATSYYINIDALNGTHFVIVYRDEGNSKYGTAITGEVSGSSITGYGTESIFYNSDALYNTTIGLAAMPTSSGDAQFATACVDNTNKEGHSYVGTVEGTATPVELVSFEATIEKQTSVKLIWKTATEVNNFGFEVERKNENEEDCETIGFVEGAGNSNSPKEYSFEDCPSGAGKYFYRLKQIDLDGSYEYSNVVEVNLSSPSKFELKQNYPNPFNPTTIISYVIARSETTRQSTEVLVQLRVYDALGREVATLVNEKQAPGNYAVKFDASSASGGLTSGIYFYTLRAGDYVCTKKMILMK